MATRFKALKAALRFIQNPEGTSTNQPVAGSIAANFQSYLKKERVINYVRDPGSKPQSLLSAAVYPFYLPFAEGAVIVPLSERVDERDDINAVITACNATLTIPESITTLPRYTPSKAIVSLRTEIPVAETSQITGVRYQTSGNASYTIPMGQTTTLTKESEVRVNVLQAVNALAETLKAGVSFRSEKVG